MPPPIAVELLPHDPQWAAAARRESERLIDALGEALVTVHHVGSTAIPGIRAKPILDLIPVFANPPSLDATQPLLESLGYAGWGEYGLPGRRYYTLDDPATGRRTVQLHAYLMGSPEIARHLAFRDFLRAHSDVAQAYDIEKARCRDLHPLDSHAYSDCKCDWIRRIEAAALRTQP
jgi:GrpB-like predicted nucleotidyltransferase (UPF0157 family)